MSKEMKCLPVLLLLCFATTAQVLPEPGAVLNHTQVMLEYEKVKTADAYLIQITEDTVDALTIDPRKTQADAAPAIPLSALQFEKPLIEQIDSTTATLVSGLQFGKKYLWRYNRITGGVQNGWNGPFGFEIAARDTAGIKFSPVTVTIDSTGKSTGGLIAADFQCIIDRTGKPVWQMPADNQHKRLTTATRDLQLNPFGTITFLDAVNNPVECDLSGNILWQVPGTGSGAGMPSEVYHHQFERLPNGNYMVLGNSWIWKKIPAKYAAQYTKADSLRKSQIAGADSATNRTSNPFVRVVDGEKQARLKFGTIIEYNPKGEVVWSWSSEKYLNDEEVYPFAISSLMQGINVPGPARSSAANAAAQDPDAHMNAFWADEENKFVYAGFRQLSRVIKIDRKTGSVVASWGETTGNGKANAPSRFFKLQHGATLLKNGNLMVYNNGDPALANEPSAVVIFSQPTDTAASRLVWQFPTVFNGQVHKSSRAGNAEELPNGNLLVCTGNSALPTGTGAPAIRPTVLFEVNRNKEIVWQATVNTQPYRAHYASSLYPNYFTAQIGAPYLSTTLPVTVYNEGTEPDDYYINLKVTRTGSNATFKLNEVAPGGHGDLNVVPGKLQVAGETVDITISSITNPANTRKFTTTFK